MPTQLISLGPPTQILQNVVYALPAQFCHVTASAVVEVSVNGTVWNALTNANTIGAFTSGAFIRCSGGNATITCKSGSTL